VCGQRLQPDASYPGNAHAGVGSGPRRTVAGTGVFLLGHFGRIGGNRCPKGDNELEGVKRSKRFVGEILPNNPLTAINKKSCLLDGGKCDSNHTSKEAANSKDNSIKSVGLELTALRLCGHRIEDRPCDEVQRLRDCQERRELVRIPQTQKISGLRK
jgi:hypothetical protein